MDELIDNYLDIINLDHYRSSTRQPLPMSARAAQFAPFAALHGHEEMIAETNRLTEDNFELSDDEAKKLSKTLSRILSNPERYLVKIRHFSPDSTKTGGHYQTTIGYIKKIDDYTDELILVDRRRIPLQTICSIQIEKTSPTPK